MRKMREIVFPFLTAFSLLGCSALAQTFYVGSCHTGSFPTISSAVNSSSVPAGSTIRVCPGTYVEQLVITKSLTLQGITSSGSDAATIVGSITDSSLLDYLGMLNRPSVLVEGATVNLTNINIIANYTDTSCSTIITGIFYASGGSGTVNHVNMSILPTVTPGCLASVGIWAENENIDLTTVTIQNSTFEVLDQGIWAHSGQLPGFAPVLSLTATSNQIFGAPSSGNGVYVSQATGTISSNVMAVGDMGVNLDTNAYILVTNNTIDGFYGAYVQQPKPTITNNKIRAYIGIDFLCNAGTVTGNIFMGGWGAMDSTGLYFIPVGFSGTNTFYNVMTPQGSGC